MDQRAHARMFAVLYKRVAETYAHAVPERARRAIEFMLLLKALCFFFVLVYIHVVFTKQQNNCLLHIANTWPRDGVLRVEVLSNVSESYALQDSYIKEYGPDHFMKTSTLPIVGSEQYSFNSLSTGKGVTDHLEYVFGVQNTQADLGLAHQCSLNGSDFVENITKDVLIETNDSPSSYMFGFLTDAEVEILTRTVFPEERYIVEYALEYGLLRLSPKTREKLNVTVMLVTLDSDTNKCLGEGLSRFIMNEFLGFDDVLMSSIKVLAEKENNKGFFRNVVTNEHFRFVSVWMARSSYIAAAFVMIVFSLSISMLLRYSHHQILIFIADLLNMIETNTALTFPAAPLLTVILALVGMEAIMSEFFNDTVTAFYIIVIIWLADQYDAICSHSSISKRYWLRFFFLYHFGFYAYHYRFNGQYSALALMTSWLFIQHSMVYFFHHYEIPLMMRHNVTYQAQVTIHEHQVAPPPRQQQQPPTEQQREQQAQQQQGLDQPVTVNNVAGPSGSQGEPSSPLLATGARNSSNSTQGPYRNNSLWSQASAEEPSILGETPVQPADDSDTLNSLDPTDSFTESLARLEASLNLPNSLESDLEDLQSNTFHHEPIYMSNNETSDEDLI